MEEAFFASIHTCDPRANAASSKQPPREREFLIHLPSPLFASSLLRPVPVFDLLLQRCVRKFSSFLFAGLQSLRSVRTSDVLSSSGRPAFWTPLLLEVAHGPRPFHVFPFPPFLAFQLSTGTAAFRTWVNSPPPCFPGSTESESPHK